MQGTQKVDKRRKLKRKRLTIDDDEALIDMWREYEPDLRKKKRNSYIYAEIAGKMNNNKMLTSQEIFTKIRNLRQKYRLEKKEMGASGGNPSQWVFYSKVHEIMSSHACNTNPILETFYFEESTSSSETISSPRTPVSPDMPEPLSPISIGKETPSTSSGSTESAKKKSNQNKEMFSFIKTQRIIYKNCCDGNANTFCILMTGAGKLKYSLKKIAPLMPGAGKLKYSLKKIAPLMLEVLTEELFVGDDNIVFSYQSVHSEEPIENINQPLEQSEDMDMDESIASFIHSSFYQNQLELSSQITIHLSHENFISLKSIHSGFQVLLNVEIGNTITLKKHFIERSIRAVRLNFRIVGIVLDASSINLKEVANISLHFSIRNNFYNIPIIYDFHHMKFILDGNPFFKSIIRRSELKHLKKMMKSAFIYRRTTLITKLTKYSIENVLKLIKQFCAKNPKLNVFYIEHLSQSSIETCKGIFGTSCQSKHLISELHNAMLHYNQMLLTKRKNCVVRSSTMKS